MKFSKQIRQFLTHYALVNERVFHHGRHRDDVPLISVIGASNELPEEEVVSVRYTTGF